MIASALALCWMCSPTGIQTTTPSPAGVVYQIPYRLTETKHLIVRAKLNGKGPYSFIVDTGAPALIFNRDLAKTLGVQPDKDHWVTLNRVEIEGGAVVTKLSARVEDPFQLKTMNTIGLADVDLAGVLGYNLLARFRIEIDLERSHMRWARLDYEPPRVMGLAELAQGKPVKQPPSMAGMEQMAKLASELMPRKATRFILPRGSIGIEVANDSDGVRVVSILPGSPAEQAHVKVGDVIQRAVFGGQEWLTIHSVEELWRAASGVAAGETVKLVLNRQGQSIFLTMTAGKGL